MYLKLFSNAETKPSDDIMLIYKIFFTLLNKTDYLEMEDKKQWSAFCAFFIDNQNLEEIKLGIVHLINNKNKYLLIKL